MIGFFGFVVPKTYSVLHYIPGSDFVLTPMHTWTKKVFVTYGLEVFQVFPFPQSLPTWSTLFFSIFGISHPPILHKFFSGFTLASTLFTQESLVCVEYQKKKKEGRPATWSYLTRRVTARSTCTYCARCEATGGRYTAWVPALLHDNKRKKSTSMTLHLFQ